MMNRFRAVLLSSFWLAVLVPASAQAVTIVQYGTAGSTTSLAPVSFDASVSPENLNAGSGIDVQAFSTFNFSGWDIDNTSYADALADDEVWTWGFSVTDPLASIDLTTMDIRLDRSGTGPDDFEIRATVNSASETTILAYDFNDSSSGVNFLGVDLSALSGLTQGDVVEFTLAAFNAESAAGTFDLETITFPGNDGIVIQGDITVIPEPSTALLIGLGLAGLGVRSRR